MTCNADIVYFSPAGSTRKVAQSIEKELSDLMLDGVLWDLSADDDLSQLFSRAGKCGSDYCLFVGSPVYVSHPAPAVTDFLQRMPRSLGAAAVPFVTWGGVTSGVALYDMGKMLQEKGFRLAAAAKILALHSMMRDAKSRLGEGHPDGEDEKMIRNLVEAVNTRIKNEKDASLSLEDLAYQPDEIHAQAQQMNLSVAKAHMPVRKVDGDRCTECGICKEVCPVDALTLSPFPEFRENCIFCFNCVMDCPEDAIVADLSQLHQRLRKRAEQISERLPSRIFL